MRAGVGGASDGGASTSARWLVAVLAAVAIAYGNSLTGDFLLDARALVLENPAVHSATWANAATLLSRDYWYPLGAGGLYRPATTLSYLVNSAIGSGEGPLGYHVANLLLHLACVSLVYLLVLRTTPALASRWTATVAAALFGLHPITTEGVTYIAGRADLLATLGTLLALLAHATGDAGVRSGIVFAAATTLAIFAKESGLVLPLLLLAHDALFAPRAGWRGRYAIAAFALGAYALARIYVLHTDLPVEAIKPLDNPLVEAGPLAARATALAVGVRQLGLLLWPARLSADYSCCEVRIVAWPPSGRDVLVVGVGVTIAISLVWFVFRERARRPERSFFAVLAAVAWLPSANLVFPIGTIMAERTLYLPLVGVAAVVASLLAELRSRASPLGRRALHAALGVVLLAGGARIWIRNGDWRDERSLWSSALAAAPGSAKAHAGLAAALFAARSRPADLDAAIALGERAVAIRPDYQNALVALGGHYVVKGDSVAPSRPQEASAWYARAVGVLERARELDEESVGRFRRRMAERGTPDAAIPDRADLLLYNNLSLAYLRAGRTADALAAYERSRDLEPLVARRHADVAVVLVESGRWEEAAVELFVANAIAPEDAELETWLVELYRRFGGEPSGMVASAGSNPLDSPIARGHRCRALAVVAGLYSAAGREADADSSRRSWAPACRS